MTVSLHCAGNGNQAPPLACPVLANDGKDHSKPAGADESPGVLRAEDSELVLTGPDGTAVVFAGEVLVGAGILVLARRVADAPSDSRPHLDCVGSLLWAAAMGFVIIAVLRSSDWGWTLPAEGAFDPRDVAGRVVCAGRALAHVAVLAAVRRFEASGADPLLTPTVSAVLDSQTPKSAASRTRRASSAHRSALPWRARS